ncbi:acetate--CoA ligase [Sphaerobacter thermophilus]|uniref:AMP-dependent synthetase and ligase n=1 Tax=Sphaerobacter thermophilus (strain ATCC 49802 / DSM 20745 / KCCM 41009 / NCIMB 13125 / S 6022) TaxID=479434 RepID=D1C5Q3_SPHTD|nr:acetate--CoA ligase [Sphaerobacter thermophilus]ACZ39455.1 AMP-dependent synthetase and ligase [Sphaerobacter thermophilus DSM 20745]
MEVVNPIVRRWQQEAADDHEGFWARAAEQIPWFRTWDQVFAWDPPGFRWFLGAETNLCYNALDYHVRRGWGGHAALIAENERGERRVLTYAQLLHEVERVAAALRGLGVRRGDRVGIYMPTCAEAIIAMLATARIGAIHLVVFAGFGSGALAQRLQLAGARVLLAADATWRKGRTVPLKPIVDAALDTLDGQVERVVVLRRTDDSAMQPGRDLDWDEFLALGAGQSAEHEVMEANEPAYILATSGTTASPKLAVHSHGTYQVGIRSTADWCFGMKPTDIWWSTSDIGWVVGHSFIVYAPLLVGCTTIAYEGALDHPGPETVYRIIEENRVTGIFTSPTAARMLMRYGTEPARAHDLSSVERVFCAGELLNPPAWEWLQKEVFQDRVPVLDHWWQTETGGPVVGNPYGLGMLPIKPGSAGVPLPGFALAVMTPEGERCGPDEPGIVVIERPFPGLTPTIWGDPERYANEYWRRIPGVYYTGDSGAIDEDGYVWFSGRADEIIKIAGHRIGTAEVESAFLRHPAVAEAGVTGRPDPVRGEVISAFIALKPGWQPTELLKSELLGTVRQELGPVAVIGELNFVSMLPKTRSGKIMRRVFRAVIADQDPGDVSTIEDEASVEEARAAWRRMRAEIKGGQGDGSAS